jgi:hypothetical protein
MLALALADVPAKLALPSALVSDMSAMFRLLPCRAFRFFATGSYGNRYEAAASKSIINPSLSAFTRAIAA